MSPTKAAPSGKKGVSLSNVSTKFKVLLSAAIPLVLMLFIGAIALVNLNRMEQTQGWVDHTQNVLHSTTDIIASALDMETGMRGYLLAGQEQFLEPYIGGRDATYAALADLRETVSDTPQQVARLTDAEDALREWQTLVAEPNIALRRAIGDAPTMNDMSAEVQKGEGKVYFDQFRGQIATFIAREEALLAERQEAFSNLLARGIASEEATREALEWVQHTNKVIIQAKDILTAAVDMETGMRGFLIAGDEAFLEPFNSGIEAFNQLITDLSQTVSDNPPQVALLGEAKQTIDTWVTDVVLPMKDLRREIGDAKTMDDMADIVGEARGKQYFDGFRTLMAEFYATEQNLMEARQAENQQTRGMTETSIAIASILALLIGSAFAWAVGRNIGGGITTLTKTMRRLADGDNAVEVTGQSRGDEVGEMARATGVFKQNALKVAELNKEQQKTSKDMAALSAEREETAKRKVELAKKREEDDRNAMAEREQMIADVGQSFGQVFEAAVQGDFGQRIEATFSDGMFNELAENINQLLDIVDKGLSSTGDVLERIAQGDLTRTMDGDFRGAFSDLQGNVNGMIEALKGLVEEITGSGSTLASSSSDLRDTSNALFGQAEQNAAALEETSAALEELSASIKQVSTNVSEASSNANSARETAQSSGKIAVDAADSMNRISEASKEIAQVVSVINDIAFQINLLALNAGVEAARAGDAGRGFSVVASEVRHLAQRASEAAKEIDSVIKRSDEAVSEGVMKVSDAQSSLASIADSVVSISSGVDQIATAISEQVSGISEISTAVSQVDQNTQKQAAAFEEVTAASSVLASEADHLRQSTAKFQTGSQAKVVPMPRAPSTKPVAPVVPKVAAAGSSAASDAWEEF